MSKPDELVLYYLQGDMPHIEALFEKNRLRCHPTHSYHRMGSSGVEDCVTSFSAALETDQPGVIADVTHGVVYPVNTKLLCVLWLVSPGQLNVARRIAVRLGLLEFKDMIDLDVKW